MDHPSPPKPSLAWRLLRFPLTRLILLGGLMLLALAMNNGFMTQFLKGICFPGPALGKGAWGMWRWGG